MQRSFGTMLLAAAVFAACAMSASAQPRELYYNSCDTGTADGVVGKAIKGTISEEVRGKLDMDRGTVAYFYKPSQTVQTQEWGGLSFDVAPAFSGYWGLMYALNLRGADWGVDLCDVSRYTQRLHLPSPVGRWKGDTWVHVAIVWDRDQGIKYYEDGKLLAGNWGKNRWEWNMIPAWLTIGERDSAVDEVHIYSDCLSDAQVAQLSKKEKVAGEPLAIRPSAERRADDLARMGWADEDLKQLPTVAPAAAVAFTFARITRAIDVVRWETKPFDGIKDTPWPNYVRGVEMGKQDRRLDLTLAPGQTYNGVRIFAQRYFEGKLGRFSKEMGFLPLVDVHAQHANWHAKLDKPISDTELALARSEGWIGQISFYNVDAMTQAPTAASLQTLGDLAKLDPLPTGSEGVMVVQCETPARFWNVVEPRTDAVAAWQLATPEFGGFQFVSQPLAQQGAYDGILVKLVAEKMTGPTPLRIEVKEPITNVREWMVADVVLTPRGQGRQTFTILLKGRPVLNAENTQLPIMVTAANPITWAMGQGGSSFSLCMADKDKVRQTAIDDQVEFMRDYYSESSEGRETIWGLPFNRWPGGYYALKWLYDYAKDDPRAALLLNRLGPTVKTLRPIAPLPPWTPAVNDTGAPDWAFWQLQAIKDYNGIFFWWIDHHQAPNGELGNTWNDNCDLVENWLGQAMSWDTDDQKIKNSLRKVWETAWRYHLTDGWTPTIRDYSHAYEEGTGPMSQQLLVDFGDPVTFERMMIAETNLKKWTATNPNGTWRFRSWMLGAPGCWDYGTFAKEVPGQWVQLEPFSYIWWYNRHPTAAKWITTWDIIKDDVNPVCEAFTRTKPEAEQQKVFLDRLKQMVADGRAMPGGIQLGNQYSISNTLADLGSVPQADWEPIKAEIVKRVIPGLPMDDKVALIADGLYAWRQTDPYWLAWLATNDTKYLTSSYKQIAGWTSTYWWLHTIGQTNGDRIAMPDASIIRARMGAYPSYRSTDYNWWPNYGISYEKGAAETAALVTESTNRALSVRFFAMTDAPHKLLARVWRIDPGTYTLTILPFAEGAVAGDAKPIEQRNVDLTRGSYLELTLPAKKEVLFKLTPVEGKTAPMNFDRPDVAISPKSCSVDLGEHLQVTVYNLGPKPAENVMFRVTDGETGNVVYETTIPHIDATTDFNVAKAVMEFQNVNEVTYRQIIIEVDPEHKVDDMNPFNNRVVMPGAFMRY